MTDTPRVLVATTWFPDREAPSRTPFCLEHAKAAQTAGAIVEVVHVALGRHCEPRQETYDGLTVHRLGLQPRSPRSWLTTTRFLRRQLSNVDVLHTMAFSSILVAAGAWLGRRRWWVHTEHWNGVVDPASVGPWWVRLAFLRHALRLPHRVTGVTAELAAAMAPFARPQAVCVVPCVVETDAELAPYPPPTPLRIVGVGHLIARKDPLTALDTIRWLVDQGSDVRYAWVGDGPLREEVHDRVRALGLQAIVTLVGAVPPEQVRGHVRKAHLFFVPSRQENFLTAAAEAIASGRMVVLPRSGGFVEYCTDENSVLCRDHSAGEFGAAILAAKDRLTRTDPSTVARTVVGRFSRAAVGEALLAAYADRAARSGS